MKLIIFGHKQHGKDTAADYLASRYGIRSISSSKFALENFLYVKLNADRIYESVDQCYADRVNHRELWYREIKAYNTPDKARLGREIFRTHSIYCGIRDREEFYALRKDNLFDLAIFIDASDRCELESTESMKLSKEDADLIITNNGTLMELEYKLNRVFDKLLR